jgi:uncharacterized protein YbjT (DUF2867 family)
MSRILVVGATGRVGTEVVKQLLEEGVGVRALSRRPGVASLPLAAEVVQGDLEQPETVEAALDGVTAAFLLWTAPPATAPAIISLLAQRVSHVVYLSSPHQTEHPFFRQPNPMAAMHAELERLLGRESVRTTILRPGMFASNTRLWWAPEIARGNVVRWPFAAVETAPIDERDIAAVAVKALLDRSVAGGDYVLTGPAAISHADQLRTIGAAIGRDLQFVEQTPEEFRREMLERVPAGVINMLLNAWSAALGVSAYLSDAVTNITGRPARTFRQWAEDHVTEFPSVI